MSEFIIVRLSYAENEHPCNILNRSAGFCKMSATWEFGKTTKNLAEQECLVKINNMIIEKASHPSKNEGKMKTNI